jgi:hypothetical protein
VDFADNCLDEDIRPMLETQAHALRFVEHDLTEPLTQSATYGFCTDVLEHIPTEDVDKVWITAWRPVNTFSSRFPRWMTLWVA